MTKRYQWQEFDQETQDKKANIYLENMKILNSSSIPYSDEGPMKYVRNRRGDTFVTMSPYDGTWIIEFVTGEKKSGRGFRDFVREWRKHA